MRIYPFRPRRGQRGVALILTLLVLSVLVVVVSQLAVATRLDLKISQNYRGDVQNTYAIRAGISYAKLFLKSDLENAPDADTLHETWAKQFEPIQIGEVELQLWIEDEDRRFNLNTIVDPQGAVVSRTKDQLTRLLQILRTNDNSLVPRLVDYVDKNTEGLFEKGAKNRPLYTAREIRAIEGFTDIVLFGGTGTGGVTPGLLPFATTWSATAINVNTAPVEVLQSLHPDMSRNVAEAIVHWRSVESTPGKGNVFQQLPGDLTKVPGLKEDLAKKIAPSLAVKSTVFLVHLRARRGSIEQRVQAILRRDQGIVKTVALFQDQTYRSSGILDEEGEKEEAER